LSFCFIRSFPFKEVFLDRSEQEDVPTLIDRKVQSHPLDGIFCQVTAHVAYMLGIVLWTCCDCFLITVFC
jgi:hypothetical protein